METEQIKHTELTFQLIVESSPNAIVLINKEGKIAYINTETEKLFGYTRSELIGQMVEQLIPGRYAAHHSGFRNMFFQSPTVRSMGAGHEFFAARKDGIEFPIEIGLNPVVTVDGTLVLASIIDISERKKSENALKLMEQEMAYQKVQEQKHITRAIIKAQEKERSRIGQELHDNVNQILAATKMFLSRAGNDEASKEIIKYPIELIDNSIEEIRLLSSRNVTPLKDVDLTELIKRLVDNMKTGTNISPVFEYDVVNHKLDDDLKLNIYRIIQEQINNITKYAGAKNISISIRTVGQNILVNITDDGRGFDTGKKTKGIGLTNMVNRIESYNGNMNIESSPGKGCKLEIIIPI
jgi:PAS domain S-box-containing protein